MAVRVLAVLARMARCWRRRTLPDVRFALVASQADHVRKDRQAVTPGEPILRHLTGQRRDKVRARGSCDWAGGRRSCRDGRLQRWPGHERCVVALCAVRSSGGVCGRPAMPALRLLVADVRKGQNDGGTMSDPTRCQTKGRSCGGALVPKALIAE